jgi:hypothetical protein
LLLDINKLLNQRLVKMIMTSDKDYKETKLIKQNKRKISSEFVELAEWINLKFDVFVLNVFYDSLNDKNETPRLNIIFEFKIDELKFRDGQLGNFDRKKQKLIAEKFQELVSGKIKRHSFLEKLFGKKHSAEKLFVIFSSFEPIAKDEANSSIPNSEIDKLKSELGLIDIWEIYRQFSGTTFFFYTDKQVDECSRNGTKENLSKIYFNLLKRYDDFGYFKEDNYSVMLDSKENFDTNYESSWFYYSR